MKRLIGISVSFFILAIIIYKVGTKEFIDNFKNIDLVFLTISLLFFIPQTIISAIRWQWILHPHCEVGLGKATSVILAANSLNAVLPSKIGDFAKALFHKNHEGLELTKGIYLTIMERVLDVAALCFVLLCGALLIPESNNMVKLFILFSFLIIVITICIFSFDIKHMVSSMISERIRTKYNLDVYLNKWQELIELQKSAKRNFIKIILVSILLWFLHITQIYFFFLSFNATVPLVIVLALVPVCIFVGLIPISFAGIGTRDASLIYFFSPYAPASIMAGIGILVSSRYFIPALVGLPFLHRLGFSIKDVKKSSSSAFDTLDDSSSK